jgi:glycerate dehydrogenase
MQAVFLDYETVSDTDLDTSGLRASLPDLRFYGATAKSQIAERIGAAQVVLLNKVALCAKELRSAKHLRLIVLAATGTDNIDLAAARERGIAVCNVRGYCTQSVAQHVWAMILALTQHLFDYHSLSVAGAWAASEQFTVHRGSIRELSGRTLGIVGWGELGRAVAKLGEAFGMRVLVANRPGAAHEAGRVALDELLRIADIVSLHCPLTEATRGLIGARELALMKTDALLVNTARGALVDGAALAQALRQGRLGGAGIDVLTQEPPQGGDPLLDPTVPRLVVTPHIAWAAREARQRCLDEMAENIRQFLGGGTRGRVV